MDSQENNVSAIKTYTEKGKSYLQEAVKTSSKNSYHLAIQEFVLAYKHALLLNLDRAVEVSCLFNLGAAYIAAEYFSRGVDVLTSILNISLKNHESSAPSKGDILFNIGCAYDKMKQYDEAIRYYHDALSEYRLTTVTFSPMLCETLVNLGKVYLMKGDKIQAGDLFNNAAQRYFEQNMLERGCEALLEKVGTMIPQPDRGYVSVECRKLLSDCTEKAMKVEDLSVRSKLLNEIGLKLTLMSDYEEALKCFQQSLQLCSDSNRNQQAQTLQNIGAVYSRVENYRTAITFHKQSIAVHGELGNRNSQGQCFCNLAYAQSQLGNYESAKESYNHALQAFKDTSDKNGEWQVYEGLAAVAILYNRAKQAIQYYQLAIKCQALTKDFNSQAQDRLIRKLTYAIGLQAQLDRHPSLHFKSPIERKPSRRRSLTDRNKLPNLPLVSTTEVDAPIAVPRPPPPSKKSSRQQSVDDVIPTTVKPTEESLPQITPEARKPAKRQFNRGRRGYGRGEERPFVQVARGLSSLTELSLRSYGTLDLDDDDLEDFSGDDSFAHFDSTMPFYHEDDVDGTYQSFPAGIQYRGMLYSPTPETLKHVSRNLQNVTHISRTWRKNGKRAKSADPNVTGTRTTSALFEEPLSEELPEQRPPSAAARPSTAGILKRRPNSSSRRATDLFEGNAGLGGLSVSEESDHESGNLSDTDYAGRYKEQLQSVDEAENVRSSSSSSSSSSDEEDLTTASTSADVTATQSSMPSRTVPQPPKKPPRKGKTYEKPLQGPHVKDGAIYSQSTKKSIRFSPEVKNLEDTNHTYQSLDFETKPGDNSSPRTAEDEDRVYETFGKQDERKLSDSSDVPPLSSLKIDQPVPPVSFEEEDGAKIVLTESQNPLLSPLHVVSDDSPKKQKSKLCVIM